MPLSKALLHENDLAVPSCTFFKQLHLAIVPQVTQCLAKANLIMTVPVQDAARSKYGYRPKVREGDDKLESRSRSRSRERSRHRRHDSRRRSTSVDRASDRRDRSRDRSGRGNDR